MVTAGDVGLQIMEVTAILLPLMGLFVQMFIRNVVESDVGWSDRRISIAYFTIAATTTAIVIAGAAAILPFINSTTPTTILLPLISLYIGYFGVAIVIVALASVPFSSDEGIQQLLLSSWGDDNTDRGE